MKHPLSFASGCLTILTVVVFALFGASCSETETTDSTPFTIYYSGMTDIGPSMNAKVSAPTYLGATPSEFTLTKVTLANQVISNESFVIEPGTGSISIQNTADLAVGLYRLSVACVSNGSRYEFADAVSINMMQPVPEGISVEPNLLTIDYADTKTSKAKAQVKTEGEHVSISRYAIAEGAHKEYFAISSTGEVSLNKSYSGDILPGIYKVALVLKTDAGEGIFPDAVTFNITSKPLTLTYAPNSGKMEEATQNPTSYITTAPTLKGSLEGVTYSIHKVTPATDKITIDPATGILTITEGHSFKAGEKYEIDVNAKNVYNTDQETGTLFEHAFTLQVVSFIRPIENFTYESTTKTQAVPFAIAHNSKEFKGDEVIFELGTLTAELQGQLIIDQTTGVITSQWGNTIPVGTHTIPVKASNVKGEQTTTLTLTIQKNKNFFTTIDYGNNLQLPASSAYQYRINSAEELTTIIIPAPKTDIPEGAEVKWDVENRMNMNNVQIDATNGSLILSKVAWREATCGMVTVRATVGTAEEAVAVRVPVFFHFAAAIGGVTINYTPFVLQVNPKTGGRSVTPTLTGISDESKLLMDYRRTFAYFNLNGSKNHVGGVLNATEENLFIAQVWRNFYTAIGGKPNYGAKKPMSYYENKATAATTLAYVDPADKSIVINPSKWMGEDREYANGVMSGQITFVTNGLESGINNGNQTTPILVWMDEKF